MNQAIRIASFYKPNRWDAAALLLIIAVLSLSVEGLHDLHVPLASVSTPITLSPSALPGYALRSVTRMLLAMVASLLFTFTYATLAAKSRHAERLLIPILDILQSVPVLGFLSFTVTFFLHLFPGPMGAECAAIFAIFTSQAWNMAFSFYQSLKTIPVDLQEASRAFRFSGWQRFWQLEVPYAMPGLVWNMMISMSGGWFFVVASEAITVGSQTIQLPGIGAYVAEAIVQRNVHAVLWALAAMALVIAAYDQLLFRPLIAWSEKFRFEQTASGIGAPRSWVLTLLQRTRLLSHAFEPLGRALYNLSHLRFPLRTPPVKPHPVLAQLGDKAWSACVIAGLFYGAWRLEVYVAMNLTWPDITQALLLGLATLGRVIVLIALASLIWVPIGVLIGLNARLARIVQPLAQAVAAFPANLLFPVAVMGIARFDANPDIWLSPLMILGTQWYILFNVIAGAANIPGDFREVAGNFHLRGWQWWRTLALPGIFSAYVTGALAASGGAWNASIVAEWVRWGDASYSAHGLGAYIAGATEAGDYPRIVLGIAVMSLYVTIFNRLLWSKLYSFAQRRFAMGE